MADWYVSSAAYSSIATFTASHAYSIGDFVRATSASNAQKWVFRCTTAGTSSTEPSWNGNNNGTSTSGGATFTNVSGQSSYFWSAAAGDLPTLTIFQTRLSPGDRVFISSDHTESAQTNANWGNTQTSNTFGLIQFLCVNRAGSTPPASGDLTTGASVTCTSGSVNFGNYTNCYYYGIAFTQNNNSQIFFGNNVNFAGSKASIYMKNCSLTFGSGATSSSASVQLDYCGVVWDNTTFTFNGNSANSILVAAVGSSLEWINTPSAISGTQLPTYLFNNGQSASGNAAHITLRGVDISGLGSNTIKYGGSNGCKVMLDSCKVASGTTRLGNLGSANSAELVELFNCFDGTNIISERHCLEGDVTTEFSIVLSGGAQDDVGQFSHKMIGSSNANKYAAQLCGFWMDTEVLSVGSAKTATVEIISSGTLNNDQIYLYLEHMGTSSTSQTSFVSSGIMPANPLTTASAVTSSSATWLASPSSPVKQKLTVTFTPQVAGRIRGQVRLGTNTTVYYNPQMTVA